MNEVLIRKYTKQIMKYGINKKLAYEIADTAYSTCKGKNMELYIKYAIELIYGGDIAKQFKIV